MLSSSTDSDGDNARLTPGPIQVNANDSDDIQTISSGSEDAPEEKRSVPSRLGEIDCSWLWRFPLG